MKRLAGILGERAALASARMGVVAPGVPLPLFDAYMLPMGSAALVTACRVGLPEALPGTKDELARQLDLDPEGLDVLLRALETIGYVRSKGGRYRLTRAGQWLKRDRLGEVIADFVPEAIDTLGHLETTVRGGPPGGLHDRPPDDPFWRHYERAMAQLAALSDDALLAALPKQDPKTMLDLAGGPGGQSIALCRRYPELRSTVVELPGAAAVGREHVAEQGLADRITYLEADLFTADLPQADLVMANGVLHTLSREQSVELLRRARDSVAPGGTFASLNVEWPEPGERSALFGGLASLVFFASTKARAFTAAELAAMAQEAGLDVRLVRPTRLPGSLVIISR